MVTGQKTIPIKNKDLATESVKELSIQVNLNGLSFCILNHTDNVIELLEYLPLEHKTTPFKILEHLKSFIKTKELTNQNFDEVIVVHHNELSTFVPKELFVEANSADYLKLNSKILQTDFISHDELYVNKIVNVYVPYVNINNYIFDTFGAFTFKHSSTVLVNSILQANIDLQSPTVFINVNASSFEFVALKNKNLVLYNTFEYASPEDFIYFILFTMEQLGYDPETVTIQLTGQIKENDDLYNILYTYVRHVNFYDYQPAFNLEKINGSDSSLVHFLILNSF